MNKRQRKQLARKRSKTLPPWAGGRFSRLPEKGGEEVFVVYVARPVSGAAERQVGEEQVLPYMPDAGSAVQWCHNLVDSFLEEAYQRGMSADKLFARYRQEGPDPYILYEERGVLGAFTSSLPVAFNAWGYAECACRRLCGDEPGEPSRSLALWQWRYQEYDRKRMAAQLLLWRRVRLTQDCSGMIGTFPAGTEGIIGMHAYYIGASTFDWSVELPIMFDVADERGRVTFGIPYDAMEFVESDSEFIQTMRKNHHGQESTA